MEITEKKPSSGIRINAIHIGLRITYYIHHNNASMRTIDMEEAAEYVREFSDVGDHLVTTIFDAIEDGYIKHITFSEAK